ncbi:DUF882 domain-containing protein [Afifella pfennigii]|uniref:DUF882 domain-containing protein n=1 Tax=Afifella pfennigii TaxID=209897 RepID=UPI00068FF58C|nr:DUF882 domain-containing protein [Afifella pfennigii]
MASAALALSLVVGGAGIADAARSGDRTLKLYFAHTKERGTFTFRKNGRYDQKELKRLNHFLRDWRQNEPAQMDPSLFDLIWEVYRETGAKGEIHVVSAYRSLKTNNMLRRRSSGVAKRSQHTAGKAMDFYIPDVPLAKLRKAALRKQVGGVGYYPTSGSPFVHLDVGSVRHWPRMTRKQLLALFPDGKTLHIPSDGKPLSGYQTVLAQYGRGGMKASLGTVSSGRGSEPSERRTVVAWLKDVFDDEEAADDAANVATGAAPARALPTESPTVLAEAPSLLPRAAPAEIRTVATRTVALADMDDAPAGFDPSDSLAIMAYAGLPQARPVSLAAADAAPETAAPLAAPLQARELTALYERALAEADPATAAPTERGAIAGIVLASAVAEPPAAGLPRALDVERPVLASLTRADIAAEDPFQAIEAAAGPAGPAAAEEIDAGATLAYATMPEARPEPVAAGAKTAAAERLDRSPAPLSLAAAIATSGTPVADGAAPRLVTQRPDAGALSRLMGKDTTRTFIFALLKAPHPAGAAEFFAIPVSEGAARAVIAPQPLRTDRFAARDDLAALNEPDRVHLLIASLR